MNKGLKNYTKQIPITVGNALKASININDKDSNLIFSIPLVSTVGLNPIDCNLTFNLLNKEENDGFGKGIKLNYYKKIIDSIVYNHDGSKDTYYYNTLNKETGLILNKVNDDNYGAYHYELSDKYGNNMIFNNYQDYPKTIQYKNGNRTYIDFVASTKIINNGKGDEIKFTKNGYNNITRVEYYRKTLVSSVELSYDIEGYLNKLVYKMNNIIINSTTLNFTKNSIIVIDDISGYRVKFNLFSNKVISFTDGYDDSFINGNTTNIVYNNRMTTVTNYKGKKSYSFFDHNNFPLYEIDDNNNVIETVYDHDSKTLLSNSGKININNINNILTNNDLLTFENSGLVLSKTNIVNNIFDTIIDGNVYKVSGTGTLRKRIKVNGLATDDTLALMFIRLLKEKSADSNVKIKLFAGDEDFVEVNNLSIDNTYDLLTLGVSSKVTYGYIELLFEINNSEIEIGGIKIANKKFSSFYEYDEQANPKLIGSGGISSDINYNYRNLPISTIGKDSSKLDYDYDYNGNMKEIVSSYGVKIINDYDINNNLVSNKVISKSGDKMLECRKTYTPEGRFIKTNVDELGNVTSFDEYDALGKIKKVTNALGVVSRFNYNLDSTLNSVILSNYNNSSNVEYKYDNKKRLSAVNLSNGSCYEFKYDCFNNISEIMLNKVVVFKYEYDLKTGNLVKQLYGNSNDSFVFAYNEDNLVSSISYIDSNGISSIKYNYVYNNKGELIKVLDKNNNILSSYSYDEDGKVISLFSPKYTIKNGYDNLGNVNRKKVLVENKSYYQSFDTINRSKGSHPGSLLTNFKAKEAYFGLFENDYNITCYKHNETIKPNTQVERILDGVIPTLKLIQQSKLTYNINKLPYYSDASGNVSFWFKPSENNYYKQQYLITIKNKDKNYKDSIGVYILHNKLHLEVHDDKGNYYYLGETKYSINPREWNFVSLNFMNRYDGYGYPDVCEYNLMLNTECVVYKKQDPRLYVDCGININVNIGHQGNEGFDSYQFNGNIACLMIGRQRYVDTKDVLNYYRLTKDYIIDNALVDESINAVDFSLSNLFTINKDILDYFEIYPLQNNVFSLNDNKPIAFDIRNLSIYDKDRTFNFNNKIKRYAYVADGNALAYDFNIVNSGTIVMRAMTDVYNDKQYFLHGIDCYNNSIGLLRNSDGYVCVDINGNIIRTNLSFYNNTWHTISLSFNERISSGSMSYDYLDLRVRVDGNSWESSKQVNFRFDFIKFMIGRRHDEVEVGLNLGSYYTSYPLHGQIEMLATRPAFCEKTTLDLLFNELKGLCKVSEFDDFGMLKKVEVHEVGKTILSNTYNYKTRNDTRYISKQVDSELIRFGNNYINRKYETDALGNITSINDNFFGSHNYQYDYRGFLVNADGETYSYDGNGNITKKGNKTLIYDEIIKDRLVSYDGKSITYDSSNPLNPRSYDGNTYTFEGRRLTRLTHNSGYYKYVYNDLGLRIRKEDERGVGIDYIYDGDKLITELSRNYRLDFLYDEYGNLYGFIKDMKEKYLYIRDSLSNILGITDFNGNIMVKYNYDAWGLLKDISGSNVSLGQLNPFRYKGYYFDSDTRMYYCKSRYYVPEWGRWLNSDTPNQLLVENINGLNLYSYCLNNPIAYTDYNGKFALSALLVGTLIGVATNVIGKLIGDTVSNIQDSDSEFQFSSWESYLGEAVGGAISGAMTFSKMPGSDAVGSFIATTVTMGLENLTKKEKHSSNDIIFDSLTNALVSSTTSSTMQKIKINKINKGRGSLEQVTKSIITKLNNGTIKKISAKTSAKMIGYNLYNSFLDVSANVILESY